jgi:hypothetical protein
MNQFLCKQLSDTSIIRDASEYIKELKQRVVRLNQEITCAQNALRQTSSYPTVLPTNDRHIETTEIGYGGPHTHTHENTKFNLSCSISKSSNTVPTAVHILTN